MKTMALPLAVVLSLGVLRAEEPARELSSEETVAALKTTAETFGAHPALWARMTVRVSDLIGERTEEGWIAIARPGRVLRRFEKPAPKTWFLDGTTLREFLPGRNEIYEKDFSAAPKLLKLVRAGLGGDFTALDEFYGIKAFAGRASLRFELTKKPGAPKLLHRRIVASLRPGAWFFDEIRYEPEDGDEIVERFTEFKELTGEKPAEFDVKWPADARVTTTHVTE